MKHKRLTTGYVLLVGAPLLVVFTAAEFGRSLKAPASVHGEWRVELSGTGCGEVAGTWRIAQSGRDVVVQTGEAGAREWRGAVSGGQLSATGACGQAVAQLEAATSGSAGERRMSGTIRRGGGPATQFSAVRVKTAKGRGR